MEQRSRWQPCLLNVLSTNLLRIPEDGDRKTLSIFTGPQERVEFQ